MNRRSFIRTGLTAIGGLTAFPYLSFGRDNRKRNPKSLFTIAELREWCDKNGFKYLEESDIKRFKTRPYKCYCPNNEKCYFIYKRWKFLTSNMGSLDLKYKCLNWNALEYRYELKHFFLYDIVDTTNDWQRDKGEFYTVLDCGIHRFDDSENSLSCKKRRFREIGNIWDIEQRCWLRPLTDTSNDWWYWNGFEKV